MRITLTLPRGTSGNGTKTTGSLSQNAQGKHAPVTGREDFSDAVKAIKDLRQKDEQQSNYPILPSHQTRQRPFQEGQWTWSSWSTLSSSSTEWERVANEVDFSKSGRITIFQKKKKNIVKSFAYRKWTEGVNGSSQCCSVLLSFLEQSSSERLSCRTRGLIAQFSLCHTALRAVRLCSTFRTGPIPAFHHKDLCLAGLPNKAPSQVVSRTFPSRLAVREVATMLLLPIKASIGSTYNSGEDMVTTPAVSEVDERSTFGTADFTTVNTGERHVQHHSEFITLTERFLRHVHRTFVSVREDPWRRAHTRENQVEIQMSCRSLIQKEKGFFLSFENPRFP